MGHENTSNIAFHGPFVGNAMQDEFLKWMKNFEICVGKERILEMIGNLRKLEEIGGTRYRLNDNERNLHTWKQLSCQMRRLSWTLNLSFFSYWEIKINSQRVSEYFRCFRWLNYPWKHSEYLKALLKVNLEKGIIFFLGIFPKFPFFFVTFKNFHIYTLFFKIKKN